MLNSMRIVPVTFALLGLGGCQLQLPIADSPGQLASGYTYVPLDPFPVRMEIESDGAQASSTPTFSARDILPLLPDNAVRMSVASFDTRGTVSYGPVGVGVQGGSYRITVDYVNADTTNFTVTLRETEGSSGQPELRVVDPSLTPDEKNVTYNIPVYVGIGLRVTADVRVVAGRANLAGLGVLGAEAEARRLSGSLVVQTLGVNGQSISAALPIQSELNQTTTQNAVVAVGSIKALLYEQETIIVPRVVGMYVPFGADKQLINEIISALSRNPPAWSPPFRLVGGTLRPAIPRKIVPPTTPPATGS